MATIAIKYFKQGDYYYILAKHGGVRKMNLSEFDALQSVVCLTTNEDIKQELIQILNNNILIVDNMVIDSGPCQGVYQGAVLADIPHGKGTLKNPKWDYTGEFKHGCFDGYGELKRKDKYTYNGLFKKGSKHGEGVLQYPNGSLEKGIYSRNSNGVLKTSYYTGSWDHGKFTGKGVSFLHHGVKSEAMYKNNKKHGSGTLENDKTKITVTWQNDELLMPIVYQSGDVFNGSFDSVLLTINNGLGEMKYTNGDVYNGSWWYGKKHYSGTMKYNNGDVYIGSWRENRRDGKGKLIKADGTIYEGNFYQDKFIVYQDV